MKPEEGQRTGVMGCMMSMVLKVGFDERSELFGYLRCLDAKRQKSCEDLSFARACLYLYKHLLNEICIDTEWNWDRC